MADEADLDVTGPPEFAISVFADETRPPEARGSWPDVWERMDRLSADTASPRFVAESGGSG
jgi:hypothetical protein